MKDRLLSTYKIAIASSKELASAEDVADRYCRMRNQGRRHHLRYVLFGCGIIVAVVTGAFIGSPGAILWIVFAILGLCSIDWVAYDVQRRAIGRLIGVSRVIGRNPHSHQLCILTPNANGILHFALIEPHLRLCFVAMLMVFALLIQRSYGVLATTIIAMFGVGMVVVLYGLSVVMIVGIGTALRFRMHGGRCLECGYDVRDLPNCAKCPECGSRDQGGRHPTP